MTFRELMDKIPDARTRLVVSASLFFASDNREEFQKKYGTYGVESLTEILKPDLGLEQK